MKSNASIIAIWIASAAATFGLGWAIKPDGQPADAPDETAKTAPVSAVGSKPNAPVRPAESEAKPTGATNGFATVDLGQYVANTGTISAEDMAVAIKDMRSENDPLKRRAMFIELLDRLDRDNAKAAFLALREGRGDRGRGRWGGGDEERLLLNAWGRIDGAGAVAELQAMEEARRAEREANGEGGDRRDRDRGGFDISSVLRGWAMSDPASAIDHLASVEDDRARGFMGGEIVRGLMVGGIDNALDFIGSLPEDDGARGWHMRTVAEEVLEGGVTAAASWADSLADDSLKEGAMRRIAESYAREDLQAAVAWVETHSDESYASEAVTQVAERWAESDPQATIEWATSLPADAQVGAFREALDEWTERDAMAASEYLAGMPASPVRDSAIQGFSTELVRDDPESAATWAATIGDAEMREETLVRIGREWYRSDRSGAQEWLPNSGLSQEQQTEIAESRGWGRGR